MIYEISVSPLPLWGSIAQCAGLLIMLGGVSLHERHVMAAGALIVFCASILLSDVVLAGGAVLAACCLWQRSK